MRLTWRSRLLNGAHSLQLTLREAARFLNVAEKTLERWADSGEVPAHRINDQCRFNAAELLEWANARNLPVSSGFFGGEEGEKALPSVAGALETGGVFHGLPAADRESALRAMVGALRLPEGTDRAMLQEVLLARESLGTTAVGGGIAIPHVRSPMLFGISLPAIALFFLERPVDFASPDRQPVHALFWLVAPTVKAHLRLLSRLASVLQDPGVQALLARRAPAEAILAEVRRAEASPGALSGRGSS